MQDDDDRDLVTGLFVKGHSKKGGRAPGVPNKITKCIREQVVDGLGNVPKFVKELKQSHPPAAATLLAKMIPSGDAELMGAGGIIGDINIISIPNNHGECPDGCFRPHHEASVLWEAFNAANRPLIEGSLGPVVEPEIAELIAKAIKPKGDGGSEPDPTT
jgi:hypothetical protein